VSAPSHTTSTLQTHHYDHTSSLSHEARCNFSKNFRHIH